MSCLVDIPALMEKKENKIGLLFGYFYIIYDSKKSDSLHAIKNRG